MGSHVCLLRKMGQTRLIVIFAFAVARSTALQCYQCDSNTDGPEACNDDPANRGGLKTCPPEQNAGCFIIEIIKGELDADVIRGCTDIKNEEHTRWASTSTLRATATGMDATPTGNLQGTP